MRPGAVYPPLAICQTVGAPVTPMNHNNYRTIVVTLTFRLPIAFSCLVGDAEWATGIAHGTHGGEWGEFLHRGGAMTPGATERLMMTYLTRRGIPPPRSLRQLAQRAQQPHVPPPQPGTYGNAAVSRMMARGFRLNGSSSSSQRTATITTPPPRSCAATATRATNVRARTSAATSSTSPSPSTAAPPHTRRHTTPTSRHQRHAGYRRSGTIEGRHATEPPTRACVQTGGAKTTITTPHGHRDPGTPGITCRERSHTQPHEYRGGGHPARTTPWHRTPAQGADLEPHRKPATPNTTRRIRARSAARSQPGGSTPGPPGAPPAPWHT